MRHLDRNEVSIYEEELLQKLSEGELFIYPTDTIYGIGCDATMGECVSKLRDIKNRHSNPLSVIAPSKDWIRKNCHVNEEDLKHLPGPKTLILKLKNKDVIAKEVNNDMDTIGVRIPSHWISDFVSRLGKPVITTSVNKEGENHITSLDELPEDISGRVCFAINEGKILGRPSRIINTITGEDKAR